MKGKGKNRTDKIRFLESKTAKKFNIHNKNGNEKFESLYKYDRLEINNYPYINFGKMPKWWWEANEEGKLKVLYFGSWDYVFDFYKKSVYVFEKKKIISEK